MSVVVFVWLKSETGHASLNIDGHPEVDKRMRYVSFYPAGKREDVTSKGALFGMQSQTSNMLADSSSFKNIPDYASPPILRLDEKKMIDHWQKIRTRPYGLLTNSCATMVMELLRIGAEGRSGGPAVKAILAMSTHQPATPGDCKYVAELLAASN